jgi:phosphoribosylanthranilate isomerase
VPHLVPLLIRGINNLSDARYCAGMGADKLTFVLDPALPGALDTKTVKELAGWIAGVELIGEFDQLSAHEINAIAAECGLDAVLLRSFRSDTQLAEIAPPVYMEINAEMVTPLPASSESLRGWTASVNLEASLPASVTGWVMELPMQISSETYTILHAIGQIRPLWLGPGLAPTHAVELTQKLPLAGLSFPAGDEVKPGLRDFDQLEAVFEALETE